MAKYRLGPWGKRWSLPQVTETLQQYRAKFEAGDMYYLLLGIDLCWRTGTHVPMAFRQAFCDRLQPWIDNEVRTLDAAFAVQRPKGKHLKSHARLRPIIEFRVKALRKQGHAIDSALTKTAEQLGISKSSVSRLYYGRPAR
jgi:hypothetical protein